MPQPSQPLRFPPDPCSKPALQTELEDIPRWEFWGAQAYLHPPPKEPPCARPPPASSCN